jgi:hypothetical protein
MGDMFGALSKFIMPCTGGVDVFKTEYFVGQF